MDSDRIVQIVSRIDLVLIDDNKIDIPNDIINISNKYDLYIKSVKNNIFLICKEYFIISHSTLEFTTIRFSTIKLLNKKGKRKFKLLLIENLLNH